MRPSVNRRIILETIGPAADSEYHRASTSGYFNI